MTRRYRLSANVAYFRKIRYSALGGTGYPDFVLCARAQVFADVFQTRTLVDGLPTRTPVDFQDVVFNEGAAII